VPLFIGFVESGIPLGVTFSFLVAAPLVNEVALVMLFGMFGWQVAGLYMLSGLVIVVIAGVVIREAEPGKVRRGLCMAGQGRQGCARPR
jgi:uncharacterized membrane protein YraQ (UPF0718 family)